MKKTSLIYALLLTSLLAGCAPSDAELSEQGWVKDPVENGWVEKPGDNGWVNNPADNGWVKDPAGNGWVEKPGDNGWVKDPAGNGWVKDPAGNGWVEKPGENGWVEKPGENGWVENPEENGWVKDPEITPSPIVTDGVVHWVPGADGANCTYTVDLNGCKAEELSVVLGDHLLHVYEDFEYNAETKELKILGTFLADNGFGIGEHKGLIITPFGSTPFKLTVIATPDAEGSTIPLKTISDVDMSGMPSITRTTPVAGAPELFITEISAEMGNFNYVEVFNNTTSEYNLKNHRIVLGDLAKQDKGIFESKGLVEEPMGMASGCFIYQDYKIPALSSALIWIVNTAPWVMKSYKMEEVAGAETMILGDKPENLNVGKFKDVHGLAEETLVFPTRMNYMLTNGTYGDLTNGFGAALAKSSSNHWKDINSSVANRIIQIQKYDDGHKIREENGKFFYYEMGVNNPEELIYADGALTPDEVFPSMADAAISNKNRQTIHSLYARKVEVKGLEDPTPTGNYILGADGIDLYSADKPALLAMLESDFVTPIASALVYPNLLPSEENPETVVPAKWTEKYPNFAMQYANPVAGKFGTLSRFVPLEGVDLNAFYAADALKEIKLAGLAASVEGYNASSQIKVPVDNVYPLDYLGSRRNTVGRIVALNIIEESTKE